VKLPFVTRRQYARDLAHQERGWHLFTERAAANHRAELAELNERYAAVCTVNNHLTEALVKAAEDLAASRRVEGSLARQLHAMAQPVEPTDEHMDELNRLLAELHAEKARADRLQRRLDDAVGLASPRPLDSSVWQPGYVAPKPDKETTP
jgi:uncharacterized protein YicC (UPF0701 family)